MVEEKLQNISLIKPAGKSSLEEKLESLCHQVSQLQHDVQFIKGFFVQVEENRERERQRKEQKRLELERQEKEAKRRRIYEDIVWKITRSPYRFMPAPDSKLSKKEMEMVVLLAYGKTDAEVAARMNIKENSIGPRICAINKTIGTRTKEEVIAYYRQYRDIYRKHRHQRTAVLLHWLLNPPQKSRPSWSLSVKWKRVIGRGKQFYNIGTYIPASTFKSLREYEKIVLKLKLKGFDDSAIAEKTKLKPTTVRSYLSDMKRYSRWKTGKTVSDVALLEAYRRYLKRERQRELGAKKGKA